VNCSSITFHRQALIDEPGKTAVEGRSARHLSPEGVPQARKCYGRLLSSRIGPLHKSVQTILDERHNDAPFALTASPSRSGRRGLAK
jgi:hypothetical protein